MTTTTRLRRLPLLLVALAGACLVGSVAAAAPPIPAQLHDLFQRYEAYGFSGAVRVVFGGQVLLDEGYGVANAETREPVTPETVFGVGSISKQFTATGILVLERRGQLSTESTIDTYFDYVPEDKRSITLHHLLTHTSGLPDAYWDQHRDLPRDHFLREVMTTRDLVSVPGTRFGYSNYGYELLGRIIEIVSGMSYEAYLREELFTPAGMSSTGYALPDYDPARVGRYDDPVTVAWTSGGIEVSNPLERLPCFAPIGSGGILSTLGDLHAWHDALLGEAIATEDMKAKLFTPVVGDYGYGWRSRPLPDGAQVLFHGGYDDSLGLAAGFYRIPAYRAAIIILSNTILNGDFRADDAALNAFAVMNGQPVALPPPGIALPPERLDACTGRYVLDGGAVVEVVRCGNGIAIATRDPDASRMLTFPEAYAAESVAIALELERILKGMAADDYDPIREASWPGIPFERLRERYRQWWRASTELLGELRSTGLAHEVTREMERETEIFIGLQFERGVRVIRARRNASSEYLFDVPDENRLELRLAAQNDQEFRTWRFRLRTGSVVRFDDDGLEIANTSGTAVVRGRRAP